LEFCDGCFASNSDLARGSVITGCALLDSHFRAAVFTEPKMVLADHNVTIDPAAPATPVAHPEIEEVIDLVAGDICNVREFISGHRYSDLIEARVGMRQALAKETPRHICAICGIPVYLVANTLKHFFFRHKSEDGSCPAITRGALTQEEIRARKYHGLRESEAHKRIKILIERSLRADPAYATESIVSEKRWNSAHDSKKWRQPDVQAVSAAGKFAFEAQLSTTFLDVVVSRRLFYQAEGASLVWVLGSFSPDYRRLTTDDLLFSNNSNIFVVDNETVRVSEEKRSFHLKCFFRRPFRHGDVINASWDSALVAFVDLVRDLDRQRIYHFDCEGAERGLKEELDQRLREEVIAFWLDAMTPYFDGKPESLSRWEALKERLEARGAPVPAHPNADRSFRTMMHAVLSALNSRPVGWQFDKLIQVAHQLAQGNKENLLCFGFALESAGNKALLEQQDATGLWARKCDEFRPRVRDRDPDYMPNQEWLPVLSFLFPEVGGRVSRFLASGTAVTLADVSVE
jgi:hypothetical protein